MIKHIDNKSFLEVLIFSIVPISEDLKPRNAYKVFLPLMDFEKVTVVFKAISSVRCKIFVFHKLKTAGIIFTLHQRKQCVTLLKGNEKRHIY